MVPSYENHPVEGYIFNEPDGRRRPGRRYRNPVGDKKVLQTFVAMFVLLSLAIGLYTWVDVESRNTLTEWAFGDDSIPCSPGASGNLVLPLDLRSMIEHYPELEHAAGLELKVEGRVFRPRRLLTTERVIYDVSDFDWTTRSYSSLHLTLESSSQWLPVPDEPRPRKFSVNLCDLELRMINDPGDVPAGAAHPR